MLQLQPQSPSKIYEPFTEAVPTPVSGEFTFFGSQERSGDPEYFPNEHGKRPPDGFLFVDARGERVTVRALLQAAYNPPAHLENVFLKKVVI